MTQGDDWHGEFEAAEIELLQAGLRATPEQRLEWLEEAQKLAQAAGALDVGRERDQR